MAAKFKPGSVVWAKCGTHFWPAEVMNFDKLPEDIRDDFPDDKKPQFVVKFFDEDGYEFLKNDKNLYPYDCDKKEDYIKKGLAKSRAKSKEGATTGWFAKFPQDVIRSEKMTGGDVKILEKDPYVEQTIERTNYKEIFVNPDEVAKKTSGSAKRKASSTPTTSNNSAKKKVKEAGTKEVSTPPRPISHPRFKPGGKQHQVRIMQQPSTPYHLDLQMKQEKTAASSPGAYTCHICGFAASRLNVFILHNKSHSFDSSKGARGGTSSPSTPASKGRKKAADSTPVRPKAAATPKTPKMPKTPKTPKASNSAPAKKATTPKSAATPVPAKRGRGRPSAASIAAAKEAEPEPDTPTMASSVEASPSKKPRMTKKKKDQIAKEQEKKVADRKKIFGEWDEEEDGEAEAVEKKKIKDTMGGDSDDEESDVESDQEAYFQDDNIQGNTYGDEDDEEIYEDEKPAVEAEKEKNSVTTTSSAATKNNGQHEDDDPMLDIGKVLEETKVPDLPDIASSASPRGMKKSVKFCEQVSKEMKMTKMALVQPKTNMVNPMEIDDEFELADEIMRDAFQRPPSNKTILKRRSRSPPPPVPESDEGEEQEDEEAASSSAEDQVSSTEAVSYEPCTSTEEPTESYAVTSTETAVTSSDDTSTSEAAATMLALGQGFGSPQEDASSVDKTAADGDTYLLLVDDASGGTQLDDQLNSQQTFYIDSKSLENGDMSNMVLTTGPPAATTTESAVTTTSDNNGHHLTAETSGGVCFEQQQMLATAEELKEAGFNQSTEAQEQHQAEDSEALSS